MRVLVCRRCGNQFELEPNKRAVLCEDCTEFAKDVRRLIIALEYKVDFFNEMVHKWVERDAHSPMISHLTASSLDQLHKAVLDYEALRPEYEQLKYWMNLVGEKL